MTEIPPSVPPGGSYTPPPPPPPTGPGAAPGSDRTIMLVLSYLGILALIPLLTKKDDPEVQWHAKNGLMLTAAYVVFWIVWSIFSHFLPSMACFLTLVPCAIGVGYLALIIVSIMKAVNGQRFRLPVLSDMADKM